MLVHTMIFVNLGVAKVVFIFLLSCENCTVNKKRMIKGMIEVIYLYKVFSLYIIRD
jgi:hypothetical protein